MSARAGPLPGVLLAHRLEPAAIVEASKHGVSIAYEENPDGLRVTGQGEQITVADSSPLFFKWTEETIAAADSVFEAFSDELRSFAKPLGLHGPAVERTLRAQIARLIAADFRLVVLGRAHFPDRHRMYAFHQPAIMACLLDQGESIIGSSAERTPSAWRNLMRLSAFFGSAARPWIGRSGGVAVLVEPFWEEDPHNSEFRSVFAAVEETEGGVAFLLKNHHGKTGKWLSAQGHRVVGWRGLRLPLPDLLEGVRAAVACARLLLIHRALPSALTALWPRLLFEKFKYRAVCASTPARYLLRVRGDADPYAAVVRDTVRTAGTKTITFSHGTYFYPEYYLAAIDYDFYGYSGPSEIEAYSAYWPAEGTQYIHAGQIDADVPPRPIDLAPASDPGPTPSLTVGIFTTSVDDTVLPHSARHLRNFVQEAGQAAGSIGASVLLRAKNDLKRLRGDVLAARNDVDLSAILREVPGFTSLRVREVTDPGNDRGVRAEDIYPIVDVGLVFSISTIAFALLALQKKVLVYYPIDGPEHPFMKYTPLLVARDGPEMTAHLQRLVAMSDEEYREHIRPTLDWCGRPAYRSLATDFLAQVDSDLWRPAPVHVVQGGRE